MDAELRVEIANACRVLAANGAGDLIWGHVSARSSDGRGAWLKAASWGLEEVTPARTHLVGWDGSVLEGGGQRHSEWAIHLQALRARPDANAVVHVHSRHSVALAASGAELRPVSHEANFFAPLGVPRFTETTDLILTRELGDAVAEALGGARAIFLVNHGIVSAGVDVAEAAMAAVFLERACAQQLLTAQFGDSMVWTSDEESVLKGEHIYAPAAVHDAWRYLVRSLPPW